MKIISWNVNGIRAVERKKELELLLKTHNPDVFLIQEIKAQPDKLTSLESQYNTDFEIFWHSAEKPGYAGTSIWLKKSLIKDFQFKSGMPNFEDTEGRISQLNFSQNNTNYSILNIYFPNGGKSPEAWQDKLIFYEKFLNYTNQLRKNGKEVIWAGDVNCAHQAIDLARPKDNEGKIGFHPAERAAISKYIDNNWIDIYRDKYPTEIVYSWWHVITKARARNVGWRIDYFFCDKSFVPKIKNIEYLTNQMGSDHCPVLLEI